MLLSYNDLVGLVEKGVIDAPMENINGASIDITLDDIIMYESIENDTVKLANKERTIMVETDITQKAFYMCPNEFILASSRETFNLPNNIACEYKLKSSLARCGLQHALAGWCDPAWNNSKLTLELKNMTQHSTFILEAGMKIGQIVFYRCEAVPDEASYAVKGQYNNQDKVTANKGLR